MVYFHCANKEATVWLHFCMSIPLSISMPKKGCKKKQKPVLKSPPWDCEGGSLPHKTLPSSTQQPDVTDILGSLQPDDDASASGLMEPVLSTAFITQQSCNGHQTHWQAWQDQYLVQEVLKLQPFQQPAGKPREAAWEQLAQELFKDSSQAGPKSVIDHTGDAC